MRVLLGQADDAGTRHVNISESNHLISNSNHLKSFTPESKAFIQGTKERLTPAKAKQNKVPVLRVDSGLLSEID
jgi:hypothetical protein